MNKDVKYVFESYNFVMTASELKEEGFYHASIVAMEAEGQVEKIKRGYYYYPQNSSGSDVLILQKLFPDVVLCMESALFYYGYSDRTPAEWNFAIDKNASRGRINIEYPFIKAYRVEKDLLSMGESEGKIDNLSIKVYDRDRTICDVIRNVTKIDREIFNKAIQYYIKDEKKNIPNLITYAKQLRIQNKVKELIGVWL